MPHRPLVVTAPGTAWLSSAVLASISREADVAVPCETGGVLLGYWSESPVEPVITHVVGPGPLAKHARDSFVPDHRFHNSEVARLCEVNPTLQYLGDWHTHPGAAGYLSTADYATLRKIAVSRTARAPRPLMLILGFGPRWEPVAWSLRKKKKCLVLPSFVIERWNITTFEQRPNM